MLKYFYHQKKKSQKLIKTNSSFNLNNNLLQSLTNLRLVYVFLENPYLLKVNKFYGEDNKPLLPNYGQTENKHVSNLKPCVFFKHVFIKKVYTSMSLKKLRINCVPLVSHTVVRFMEYLSGRKTLIQFYPFVNQSVTTN